MKRIGVMALACALFCGCLPALASDASDPYTLRWYYNSKGGKFAHIDSNCASVDRQYLPLLPLPEEARERMIGGPCPFCAEVTTPVFTARGGSETMPGLRVDVYPTALKMPEWEDDRVYRIHITDEDRPTHDFADLLFPSVEGGDGLAPLVRIEDLNFDGYPDLAALRIQGASNVSSTHFLYDPADGQYHHEPVLDDLSAYTLYPEQKLISNYIHDSAATGIRALYRIGEDGRPALYRRASVLNDEQSGWQKIRIRVTAYDPAGAESILMDEVREPFTDDADYRESEQKWLGLLYEGIPEAVIKNEFGG